MKEFNKTLLTIFIFFMSSTVFAQEAKENESLFGK